MHRCRYQRLPRACRRIQDDVLSTEDFQYRLFLLGIGLDAFFLQVVEESLEMLVRIQFAILRLQGKVHLRPVSFLHLPEGATKFPTFKNPP